MTDVDDLVVRFRDETEERLDVVADALLALEGGVATASAVQSLFRHVHSIKGGAGMIGLDDTYALAHAVEDTLADARDSGTVPKDLIQPLLSAVDALRGTMRGDSSRIGSVVAELSRHRTNGEDEAPPPAPKPEAWTDVGGAEVESNGAPQPAVESRMLRVDAKRADRLLDLTGEALLHERRLEHLLDSPGAETGDTAAEDELRRGRRLFDELQGTVLGMRTLPLSSVMSTFSRTARDLGVAEGKEVEVSVTGGDTRVDRVVLEIVSDALAHLLRNVIAHGSQPADIREAAGKPPRTQIEVHAEQQGDRVLIHVADDGVGVSPELLRTAGRAGSLTEVLTEAGLSTADTVSTVAGRGVGLDAVRRGVESVGGNLELMSEVGRGTTAALTLPVSVALVEALLVQSGQVVIGIPITRVSEVVPSAGAMVLGGRRWLEVRNQQLPLGDLVGALGGPVSETPEQAPAVIVTSGGETAAILCDRVLGKEELVVKSLGPLLDAAPAYRGGAILGDGRVALLVDPAELVRGTAAGNAPTLRPREFRPPRVMVVDDQFVVRELQRSILESAGYRVVTASDGREAAQTFATDADFDIIVTDIEMPRMDGLQLLETIREHPSRGSVPVVIVSSRSSPEDEQRGLDGGADAYIGKGRFDQAVLLETVARLLGG